MPIVPPPTHLHAFDLALIVVYLVGITLFGLRFRSGSDPKSRSLRSYFLADQTIPWWAIALSIVSAETSTLTIISIPGVAFAGDFGFLQIVIGYMIGRVVVALIFLPKYFQGAMLTAYQLIDQRFGPTLHKVTAGLFLFTRAAAEGVRVFAVSIVVGIAIGTRDVLSIAIISALTLLYTFEGGMAAVIWTDVVQMAIYIGGTLVAIYTLGAHVPGGWGQIHAVAAAAGKFHLFNFALNLTQSYTFWAGVLGGTFLTMASHGTDQLMVQRMLAARNLRESRLALLSSGGVIFLQFTLFLLIGAGLYVFYGLHPAVFTSADRIFPTFIVREMPVGIAGLLVAAILAAAMSNLSAALNSLSSTTVVDFYMHWRPLCRRPRTHDDLARQHGCMGARAVRGRGLQRLCRRKRTRGRDRPLDCLGRLRRAARRLPAGNADALRHAVGSDRGHDLRICGQPCALAAILIRSRLGPITIPHIAFTWYVLIGSIVTFVIGSVASLLFTSDMKRGQKTPMTRVAGVLLALACSSLLARIAERKSPTSSPRHRAAPTQQQYDFTPISTAHQPAIAAKKLPGAVSDQSQRQVVFEHAYGNRALEPNGRADDRRHHLRHGLADQVPRHRNRDDAALRAAQARVR